MRNLLPVLAFLLVPAGAHAQSIPYIEGQVGLSFLNNPGTDPFTVDISGSTFTGRGEFTYGNAFTLGAEAGFAALNSSDTLRVGVSWTFTDIGVESLRIVGTLDGLPLDQTVSKSEISAVGFTARNNANIVTANLYVNLPPWGETGRPYIGAGIGGAFLENMSSEFTFAGMAGLRFGVGRDGYVGTQYRFNYIVGPRADGGTQLHDIVLHTISLTTGLYLP